MRVVHVSSGTFLGCAHAAGKRRKTIAQRVSYRAAGLARKVACIKPVLSVNCMSTPSLSNVSRK